MNFFRFFRLFSSVRTSVPASTSSYNFLKYDIPSYAPIGLIAGNGYFPLACAKEARALGHKVVAVCHQGETSDEIIELVDFASWVKVGELGRTINIFKEQGVSFVAMAGGISRVRSFRDVKLDLRGSALLLRLRSAKDDVIMRGIADELLSEGIEVFPCTHFLSSWITPEGVLTRLKPTVEQSNDISIGVSALKAMSSEDIGQLVVVRDGVIVSVEAVEGSDAAILRGGSLGGQGTVIVKCAKITQDMRFDVPTAGIKTLETISNAGGSVLAIEAGRSILMDKEKFLKEADRRKICVVGIPSLVTDTLAVGK
ncbi:MAG TPA: UDP-2,3-diacylglucosamine diphosphatase LpxI [Oligoflexia bacterium]|nr:UDP-2,3-diacylglucosamine diphosphatase LpxI [Oligoflexia bacterium]HMP47076.1 UDP-2,3-diacylglucosamine diphosphatase LpxI [Oligoflexia bacterium]